MTPARGAEAKGPCHGLRVLDLSGLASGPYCSQMLADLGAEVIRVEAPGSDWFRVVPPIHHGQSASYEQYNRGKKSVYLDLKSDAGRSAVRELADRADIFMQNSRPGVMERLGFGYDVLRRTNERLIYLSISGFGETGPYANRQAYDGVIQALTGFMPIQGSDESPQAIITPAADRVSAIFASSAVLAAVLHRERTGEGQKVVVNMLHAFAALMLPYDMSPHTFLSAAPVPHKKLTEAYRPTCTADGHVVGQVMLPIQFERICKALGREDLLGDERFTTTANLVLNASLLCAELSPQISKMTTDDFLALAADAGAPFAKVNSIDDYFSDPHVIETGGFVDIDDPEMGKIRHLAYPATFERSPTDITRRAPKLGEHTDEVLSALKRGQA